MNKKYLNITWETPDAVIEGTPVTSIPIEIRKYYMKHYSGKGIPFSADTVREIAKILEVGK